MKKSSYRRPTDFGTIFCLIMLCTAAALTYYLGFQRYALYEAGAVLLSIAVIAICRGIQNKKLMLYVESVAYEAENAKNNTLTNFPLPIAVFKLEDTRVVWGNKQFFEMCLSNPMRLDTRISDFIPDFSGKWLKDGKDRYPGFIEINNKKYKLMGSLIHTESGESGSVIMGICYWIDSTEYDNLRRHFAETRPVVGTVILDNYDELVKKQPERVKNEIRDNIEDKLSSWIQRNSGMISRIDRDRYIFVIEHSHLDALREEKFRIIEEIRSISSPSGISASISLGIGCDVNSYYELITNAQTAGELALSRGGDQAVVKGRLGFEFYGGRGNEIETRTKVRSRVMANTFSEMVRESGRVLIMGHSYSDLDSLGSSIGVFAICKMLGVKAEIVINSKKTAAGTLLEKMREFPEYADAFIGVQDALLKIDGKTLLVVVDTNRPETAESEDVLLAAKKVAVIDHHRAGATGIDNAALSFVEPYASSASELICEIIQEISGSESIDAKVANALLAGIALDTKNFTIRTGERTFDAAAFLKRMGADTIAVKKLLQTDMDNTLARYKVMQSTEIYRGIAIAAPRERQNRVVCAQAADELLNISGVSASVVLFKENNGLVFGSARSIGDFNAQLVMEKLGGGGNKSAAAVQFDKNVEIDDALIELKAAIDDYLDN